MTPAARAQIQATIDQLQALLDADCDCPEADPVTVAELWDRYLATLPDVRWKRSVVSALKPLMARIGGITVGKLKPADWENYRDSPEIRERYGVTSRRTQLIRMKTMFTWATDSGRIARNPWARVKPERRKPKRETEISAAGEEAVLARMTGWMVAFFLVAIDSALRRDEIRLMEWSDISQDGRKITIPAGRTKTHRERIGRLTTRAADALMAIRPVPGCPWVFTNPETRQPYSETAVWHRWRAAADGAELRPATGDSSVRLHDARATAASRLVRLGASMPAVQEILGHANLGTTAAYVRVQSEDVDAAHALLEAHLLLRQHGRKGPQRAQGSDAGANLDPVSASASG
jgi:integrase